MKRLALLSTAAILPMLAITSCGDDDNPPAAAGNESEFTQEEIKAFFTDAVEVNPSLAITNQDEFNIVNAAIPAGSEIVDGMQFIGENIQLWAVSVGPFNIDYSSSFSVTPEITFPEDNSGIILKMNLDNVIKADNTAPIVSMEYILHYNFIYDIDGFHRFELDLAKSSFSVDGGSLQKFSDAEQKPVPLRFEVIELKK